MRNQTNKTSEQCKRNAKSALESAAYEEKRGQRANANWWRSRASLWLRRSTKNVAGPNMVHSMDLENLRRADVF